MVRHGEQRMVGRVTPGATERVRETRKMAEGTGHKKSLPVIPIRIK